MAEEEVVVMEADAARGKAALLVVHHPACMVEHIRFLTYPRVGKLKALLGFLYGFLSQLPECWKV